MKKIAESMRTGFTSALQFLTIIRMPGSAFDARQALVFFPICGLLIGGLLVGLDSLTAAIWNQSTVAVLDLIFLAAVSGGLHLDGLADTADGLYGRRTIDQALAIMKDSRIGAIGAVTLICCLGLKWAGLAGIHSHRRLWLLIIPALARSSALFGVRWLPYGRPAGGTGSAFFAGGLTLRHFSGMLPLILLAALTGWGLVWVSAAFLGLTALILVYYRMKIKCITGDMLGAMIEVTETALFLLAAAGGST